MPQEEMQVDQIDLQEADPADNGLDDNTSAAALSHATYLSEQLLKQQNPMQVEEPVEEEQVMEETDTESNELQALKDEIASLRNMIKEALSEDDEEDKTDENEKE